jgi:hypothetical protein
MEGEQRDLVFLQAFRRLVEFNAIGFHEEIEGARWAGARFLETVRSAISLGKASKAWTRRSTKRLARQRPRPLRNRTLWRGSSRTIPSPARPSRQEHSGVLAPLKAKPRGRRSRAGLDRRCAPRSNRKAGRDEETATPPTEQRNRPRRSVNRTFALLPKPDICACR